MRVCWIPVAMLLGCGSGNDTSEDNGLSSVSFRVDGAVVDKVACDNDRINDSSGCKPAATMDGSTLRVLFNEFDGGGTTTGTSFSIRAFDGPGTYVIDGTKEAGRFRYESDLSNKWNSRIDFEINQGDRASCTFEVEKGPADPKKGDEITGTFHCEDLLGSAPLEEGEELRITLTDGTMHLIVI